MSKPCCIVCDKKLRLSQQIKCKCGEYTCSKHMLSTLHECTFDYKQKQREKLSKELKHVEPNKIIKI